MSEDPRAARLLGLAIAIMETIIIDEKDGSYMLYVAKTKAGKRVMVAAYHTFMTPFLGHFVPITERVFSSRQPKLWRELRYMI